ncbi:MAG: hypothetical protein ACREOL_10065 [Candidatus Dormibacteria bacterium]
MTNRNLRHLLIPTIIAIVLSVVFDCLVAFVLHIPPGFGSTTAADETVESQVFSIIAFDQGIVVVVMAVYFCIVFGWMNRPKEIQTAKEARGNVLAQTIWLGVSIVSVSFAAGYGTTMLEGQTTPALVIPASALAAGAQHHPFIVQVIGQQWQWTYRYPQEGGFESQQLRVPTGRLIQFDVTSLDVTHQFWAYQLGVKVDANQGFNNIGYTYIPKPIVIDVRCGELCGLWHGYMTNLGSQAGRALGPAAFASWLRYAKATFGPETKNLPKFALEYYPAPVVYGS